MVKTEISIVTKDPTASIVARHSGKIVELFVHNGECVKKGSILAILENTSDFNSITNIKNELSVLNHHLFSTSDSLVIFSNINSNNLGDLQSAYNQFYLSYKNYEYFIKSNNIKSRIDQIRNELSIHFRISEILKSRYALMQTSFLVSQNIYRMDSILFNQNSESRLEYLESHRRIIDEELRLKSFENELEQLALSEQRLNAEITENRISHIKEREELLNQLRKTATELNTSIKSWEEKYLLISPIDGKVAFFEYWTDIQHVNSGDEVMVIIPQSKGTFGYCTVTSHGYGNVAIDQPVIIKLNSYPHKEFGTINGTVYSKSIVSREDGYMVRVLLPDNLITSYDFELEFTQEMQGEAEIITQNYSLLERMLFLTRPMFPK